jgi:type IV pilus assembly protein PilF
MPYTRGFRSICALVVLFALAGCAGVEQGAGARVSSSQLRETGEKFLAAGDIPQAIKYLSMAEQKTPKDAALQYSLALAYHARGMREEALAHFKNALALKPDFAEAYNALGTFYAEQGQYELAIENLKKAAANPLYTTPQFPMFNLGRVYEKQNNLEAALNQYKEAVRFQAHYGIAYFRMGQVLDALHREGEAREAYGKAVEYAPDIPEAQLRYGIMAYNAGDLQAALSSLSRVLKLAPYSPMASEARAYLERLNGILGEEENKTAQRTNPGRKPHYEVLSEGELSQSRQGGGMERPEMPSAEPELRSEFVAPAPEPAQARAEEAHQPAPAAQPREESASPANVQWAYVIQVASFLEKENAEAMNKRLQEKGYEVAIRPVTHQSTGTVYVVQLKAIPDKAEASKTLKQIETEEQVKPLLIKTSIRP